MTPPRRRYEDACAAAHALDLVGDRWALLVMRELLLGPRRFGDLRASLPGISANILAQRLEELEASGMVLRRKLPPPAGAQVYALTAWGYGERADPPGARPLGGAVAAARPGLADQRGVLPVVAADHAGPGRAAGLRARIGFRLGAEEFAATSPRAGSRSPRRRRPADLVLSGPPAVLAGAIYGGVPLAVLEAEGALRVEGDRALAERFVTCFPCRTRPCRPARLRGRAARWSFDQTAACRAAPIGLIYQSGPPKGRGDGKRHVQRVSPDRLRSSSDGARMKALTPYMDAFWADQVAERGITTLDSQSWPVNSPKTIRADWRGPNGRGAETWDQLRTQVAGPLRGGGRPSSTRSMACSSSSTRTWRSPSPAR